MDHEQLNALSFDDAAAAMKQLCGARAWYESMARSLPFESARQIHRRADEVFDRLKDSDWLEAFGCHPKIGDLDSLRMKFAGNQRWSGGEQAGVSAADEAILRELAIGNRRYEATFGFIFIVCASGKTAAEMLELLQARLNNEPATELRVAAAEQRRITHLRIDKLMLSASKESEPPTRGPITTHVLDTSRGRPGAKIAVVLLRVTEAGDVELGATDTDADGRIMNGLISQDQFAPGTYRIRFLTRAYFEASGVPAFYPEVSVTFVVSPGEDHYHVPLLLSPFGYSTYRGS